MLPTSCKKGKETHLLQCRICSQEGTCSAVPEVRLTGGSRTGDLYFVGGEKIAPAKLQEDYCLSIGTIAERFFFSFDSGFIFS